MGQQGLINLILPWIAARDTQRGYRFRSHTQCHTNAPVGQEYPAVHACTLSAMEPAGQHQPAVQAATQVLAVCAAALP